MATDPSQERVGNVKVGGLRHCLILPTGNSPTQWHEELRIAPLVNQLDSDYNTVDMTIFLSLLRCTSISTLTDNSTSSKIVQCDYRDIASIKVWPSCPTCVTERSQMYISRLIFPCPEPCQGHDQPLLPEVSSKAFKVFTSSIFEVWLRPWRGVW